MLFGGLIFGGIGYPESDVVRTGAPLVEPVGIHTAAAIVAGQFDQRVASESVGTAELEVLGLAPVLLGVLSLGEVVGDPPALDPVVRRQYSTASSRSSTTKQIWSKLRPM